MSVLSDIHDVFFDWYLDDHPRLLCLHAGAVEIGNALVCFPSVGKSGKSTLCAALATMGHRLYGDDVVPLDPESHEGIAFGIAPLLRRPLPGTLSDGLRSFIAHRKGPNNRRWMYLRLRPDEIAPHGERKSVSALVLLERAGDAEAASLASVGKSEMLREVIAQNFGARDAPVSVLEQLASIVESRPCYRLVYREVEKAADLLGEAFG